jgi:hypothetical protein
MELFSMDQNISIATGEKVILKNLTDELPASSGAPIEISEEIIPLPEMSYPVVEMASSDSTARDDEMALSPDPATACIDEGILVTVPMETSTTIGLEDAPVQLLTAPPIAANDSPVPPKTVSRQARFSSGSSSVSIFAAALSSAQKQTGRRDRQLRTVGSTDSDVKSVRNLHSSGALDVPMNTNAKMAASEDASSQPELHSNSLSNQHSIGELSRTSSDIDPCMTVSELLVPSAVPANLIEGIESLNINPSCVSDGNGDGDGSAALHEVDTLSTDIDNTPCLHNAASQDLHSNSSGTKAEHQNNWRDNGSIRSSSDITSKSDISPSVVSPTAVRKNETPNKQEEIDKQRQINDHRRSSRYKNLTKNGPGEDSNVRTNQGQGQGSHGNTNNPKNYQIRQHGDFQGHASIGSAAGRSPQPPRPMNARGPPHENSTSDKYKTVGSPKTDAPRKNQVNQYYNQGNRGNSSTTNTSRAVKTGPKEFPSQCDESPVGQSQAHHISQISKKGSKNWADDDSDDDN